MTVVLRLDLNRSQVHSGFVALTESVAARIREELTRQGISYRELGRRLGTSIAYVSRRLSENPDVQFKVSELDEIADLLGVPVTNFLPEPERAA